MKLPTIEGTIRRRILVNYRVDPGAIERQLPRGFRPKLQAGFAVGGICLIRLEQIRPSRLPASVGIRSENAAHRIAVVWDDERGIEREGVFIIRRDTDSWLNHLAGGRLFPGEHHRAAFHVADCQSRISLAVKSQDGAVQIEVSGCPDESLPSSSIFPSLAAASSFFEAGSLGYSVTRDPRRLDGIVLETERWQVQPLRVAHVESRYFNDERLFPPGSVEFDHALLMRNLRHQWHAAPDYCL